MYFFILLAIIIIEVLLRMSEPCALLGKAGIPLGTAINWAPITTLTYIDNALRDALTPPSPQVAATLQARRGDIERGGKPGLAIDFARDCIWQRAIKAQAQGHPLSPWNSY